MYSKIVTALIILTVAALSAAVAFQYLEMESFGLPKTLQERFFPAQQDISLDESSAESSSGDAAADSGTANNDASSSNAAPEGTN